MINIEWSPLFLDKNNDHNLEKCASYAIKFFNNNFLFMISEKNDLKSFNKLKASTVFLKKEDVNNHYGTSYSFKYKNRVLLFTSCQELGGVFWRKL
tara:strand:- start:815 stop:1102 length:288 start_codon:yes stop_codon:yes gene_type:complete